MLKTYVAIFAIMLVSLIGGHDKTAVLEVMLLLPLALVPFTNFTHITCFKLPETATIFSFVYNFVIAGIMAPIVYYLQLNPNSFALGDTFSWLFAIICPIYNITYAVLWVGAGAEIIKVRNDD